jgi:hypothetical protein
MSRELDQLFRAIARYLKDPAGLALPPDKDGSHIEKFDRENPPHDGIQLTARYDINSYDQFESLCPGICPKIRDCVDSAFKGRVSFEDTKQHVAGDILIVGTDNNGDVACFSSAVAKSPNECFSRTDLTDETGWYMAAAAIRQENQSTGLYKAMTRMRVDFGLNRRMTLFYTRTQNPRVEEGITSEFEDRVAIGQISGFTFERRFVQGKGKGGYDGMLTAEIPVGRSVVYDTLDYDRGDAHILLFRIERPAIA